MDSESLYDLAYWVLLASLLIGAASTLVLIKTGKTKEVQLQRELSKANLEASLANERAEKIKKELSWRRLSIEQVQTLISELKPYPANLKINNPPEVESSTFTEDFVKTLTSAGWTIEHSPYVWYSDLEYGISVSRTENGDSERLINALSLIGVEATLGAPKDKFTLFIGNKPPPNIE